MLEILGSIIIGISLITFSLCSAASWADEELKAMGINTDEDAAVPREMHE